MSLIIAKQQGNNIYIAADTKLSYVDTENHPTQMVASPIDGVIKTTLVRPHLCICFAGDTEGVDELIRSCRVINDLARILDILLSFHKASHEKTEFIAAVSYHPMYQIFEIQDGSRTLSKSSWIGSKKGFNQFQEYFMKESASSMGLDYRIGDALQSVMTSSVDPSVNGFLISLSNRGGMLCYDTRMTMSIVPQVVHGSHTIGHGSPQKGSYSIHFYPPNRDLKVLPIHVLQGNFGIVYRAKNDGLLWPEVIHNIDEPTFSNFLSRKYGIRPSVIGPRLEDLR